MAWSGGPLTMFSRGGGAAAAAAAVAVAVAVAAASTATAAVAVTGARVLWTQLDEGLMFSRPGRMESVHLQLRRLVVSVQRSHCFLS